MKKLLAALTIVTCICIASSAMASSGHQCVQVNFTWYGYSEGIFHAKLYDGGSFYTDDGGNGYWRQFGTAISLQFMNGWMPLYSGSKKQGFFEITDGSHSISGPNYYTIKKSKECGAVDAIADEAAEADGPKSYSPE